MNDLPDIAAYAPGAAINFDSLRTELAARLTMLVIAVSGLGAWLCIPLAPFPLPSFALLLLLLAHALIVRRLLRKHPVFGRRLLVVGWIGLLLTAMTVLDASWLPYLGLLVTFASAVLVRRSEVVVFAATALASYGLVLLLGRAYPLPEVTIVLLIGAVFAWTVSTTVYTALEWESKSRQHSQRLLTEIREHRAQLSQSVKSLNQAHELQLHTQQQLIWARKAAEEARRVKEQFAANISHELRTPLNLILGFAAVMYKNPEVYGELAWPMKLRRDISHIYRNTSHLVELVDDILDLSRIEIASFALNFEPTPLAPLLDEVVEIAGDLFKSESVRFVVDVDDDLPTLELDRTRIRQVLLNLLNNARKFTDQGSVSLTVRREDGCVSFCVADTGVGMPADKLPHLFSEFFQVDASLRRSRSGAGLGLAISKRFVDAHGGQIGVESVEGEGTTVHFTLPIQTPILTWLTPKQEDEPPAGRPRVLLLNADRQLAARIERDLKQYESVVPDDVQDAHDAVRMWEPCAVISNSSGEGEAQDLRVENLLPVPLIECPLSMLPRDTERAKSVELLAKPVTSEQLLARLDAAGSPRDILVIDDDIGFTQLVERFLEASRREYNVRHAYSGREGLEAMKACHPDFVLLDVVMPDLNGFQVLDAMLGDEQLCNIPVILLAASDRPSASELLVAGSIRVHNAMGFRPGEIVHLLTRILDALTAPRSR